MRKGWIIVPLMAVLAGCGDPLAGVEQVTDADFVPADSTRSVLAPPEEVSADRPIFAGLFRRSEPAPDASALSAHDAVPTDEAADAVGAAVAMSLESPTAEPLAETVAEPKRPKSVLGWLRRAAASQAAIDAGEEVVTASVPVLVLALETPESSVIEAVAEPTPDPRPRGLLNLVAPRKDEVRGVDTADVSFGAVIPFGEIARVCEARGEKLGKLVAQAARKGASYKLYDTVPDGDMPRTFYVTGFTDHCPRQFTAALALFGTPQMHEQLRYGLPAKEYPYSTTDKAYEKVKSRICRVGKSKPCGTRVDRLEQTTVFVSAYERFEENARWADMLLHEGVVLAAALKTP
ncbi:hypothetical protein [uncultured Tateyamaria sp.]|uniref:hypothetical protein n=1 Tax=uncultured Tateyamaria sp. TaxID=455651 RepID=UPI002611F975|nr:hypothetical protein [uncultured Tateyamaria sp.]